MVPVAVTLEAVMERWATAVETGDADEVAALFVERGVLLSSDAPTAIGRAAIREVVQGWIDAGESNDRSTTIEAFVGPDQGWLARTYAVDFLIDGEVTTERGRYLASFRRVGGAWFVEAMAIFADPDRP